MSQDEHARRRIDRVTDPDLSAGLERLDTAEVRSRRDDCLAEEAHLSYVRRVLQGQLDVVRAERRRRAEGGDLASLVQHLTDVLADAPSAVRRDPRAAAVYAPAETPGRRDADLLLDEARLAALPDIDDAQIADLVAALEQRERAVSDQRSTLLANLDRLQEDLVARYRDDVSSITDVVER